MVIVRETLIIEVTCHHFLSFCGAAIHIVFGKALMEMKQMEGLPEGLNDADKGHPT